MQTQTNKKILIVDDEKLILKALRQKLLSEGFIVESAFDGEQALARVNQEKPDLILLDIVMPKMDGISVLKQLKSSNETKNIPVIMLSNLYDDKKVAETLSAGGTEYLVKVEHTLSDIITRVKEKLK